MFILLKPRGKSEDDLTPVTVFNREIKKISPEHSFIGVNWQGDTELNSRLFSNPGHFNAFIKTLKDLNIDTIRYPGGENVAYYFWDVPNERVFRYLKQLKKQNPKILYRNSIKKNDRITFGEFLDFCKKAGIKATIQLNTHTYFDREKNAIVPLKEYQRGISGKRIRKTGKVNWQLVDKAAKYAAQQVKWAKKNNYSDVIAYWELGNEEMGSAPLNSIYTGNEYGELAARYIKEIIKVDPSVRIIRTGAANPVKKARHINEWSRAVSNNASLQEYNNFIFAVTNHFYVYGDSGKDSSFGAFRDNALYNPKLDVSKRLDFHKTILDEANLGRAVIFVNEFNASYFDSLYCHSWIGAIGNAHLMLNCANSPLCYHMDYFNLFHHYFIINNVYSNKGFGVLHYAYNSSYPIVRYPVAGVIKLLNENIKGSVLKTNFDAPGAYAVAARDGNIIKVILLNKEKSKKVKLNFDGFKHPAYVGNSSLGINVPEGFTPLKTGTSSSNPPEIAQLNILENGIKVLGEASSGYDVTLPANTLSVFSFKLRE